MNHQHLPRRTVVTHHILSTLKTQAPSHQWPSTLAPQGSLPENIQEFALVSLLESLSILKHKYTKLCILFINIKNSHSKYFHLQLQSATTVVFSTWKSLRVLRKAHIKIVAFTIYTNLFCYTYTLLFWYKIKNCCDRCFPQQIRPQTTVQLYILRDYSRALARKLELLTFSRNWEIRIMFTKGHHHGWRQEIIFWYNP